MPLCHWLNQRIFHIPTNSLPLQTNQKTLYVIHLPIITRSRETKIPSLAPLSVEEFQTSITHTSLETNKANNEGNNTHNRLSLQHQSFQKSTLRPLSTTKEFLKLTILQSFLIAFYNPIPYPFFTSWFAHPLLAFPYLPQITWFQRPFSLSQNANSTCKEEHY